MTLHSTLGEIQQLEQIGQGANGLVYGGIQNSQKVAVKFLVGNSRTNKLDRFKAEYFNINLIENRTNLVNYINYEEVQIENGNIIPAIIMKRYEKTLRILRKETLTPDEDTLNKLFSFLCYALEKIHQNGIIHRDIKPENILVTEEENFVLADFGIANFNEERYKLKGKTKGNERIGNYEFSAPEQANKDVNPAPSMDIYALGQICQWYVFGETHKGTNRRKITEIFNTEDGEIYDKIIDKCLYNNPEKRYQNISDIINDSNKIKEERRKVDPLEEMCKLNDIINATCPNSSIGIQFIEDEKYIERFVENINKKDFKTNLWFNTGITNSKFSKVKYLGGKKILLDH